MYPYRVLVLVLLLWSGTGPSAQAQVSPPRFRAVEIDNHIEIGYGVTVADMDGDRKPDIVLADKKQIVWYRNPTWEKFVIAEDLTPLDNVCIAATDIDGDGKAEVAVGAQWNPNDTTNSGAVFYLVPPEDRTKKWQPMELPHEPTVHRMRWMGNGAGDFELVVLPLHGRGNQAGNGAGVRILSYSKPSDPHGSWKTTLVSDSMHMTHNLELVNWGHGNAEQLLVAGKEGVLEFFKKQGQWQSRQLLEPFVGQSGSTGTGEVRAGKLSTGRRFVATIEPMHGNQVVIYTAPAAGDPLGKWQRHLIDTSLKEGHALACGDLIAAGCDQIVAGWRGKNEKGKVGIKIFIPEDQEGSRWAEFSVDDNSIACEDLCLADLNGDGRLDIVVAGRATRNVKIFLNQGARSKPGG